MSRGASRPSSTYSVPTQSEKIEGFPSFDDRRIPILIDGQSIDTPAELATFDLTGFARNREIGRVWGNSVFRAGSPEGVRNPRFVVNCRGPHPGNQRPGSTHNAISIRPTPSNSQGSLSQATRFANAASAPPPALLLPRPGPMALGRGAGARRWSRRVAREGAAIHATDDTECLAGIARIAESLGLDAGRLDDRPPLLNLGLVVGAKRSRRLFLAGHNLLT
jgi:hypothetical protein